MPLRNVTVSVNRLGDNCIQNFHLGRYIVGYPVGNLVLRRRLFYRFYCMALYHSQTRRHMIKCKYCNDSCPLASLAGSIGLDDLQS